MTARDTARTRHDRNPLGSGGADGAEGVGGRACVICGASMEGMFHRRKACSDACILEKNRRTWAAYRERVRNGQRRKVAEQRCFLCGEVKSANAFGQNRSRVSGLQNCCKSCRSVYDHRPDQAAKARLRKHVWYLLHYEEYLARKRRCFWIDPLYRARVNAANHARYHSDPKGVYQRARERQALRQQWETEDARRCFCGRALPAGEEENGPWFCRAACKIACSGFVCGLTKRGA